MIRKSGKPERKVPGGIALRPPLWERIDALAEAQEKSRNQVIEEVLSLHVPVVRDFRNSEEKPHGEEDKPISWREIPDGDE